MQIHLDTMLLTLLIASSLVIFSMWLGRRVTDGVPVGAQNFMETIVGFVNTTVNDNFPVKNPFIAPLALTIFVFILMCNTLDVLPAFLLGNVAHMFGVEHFRPVPTNDLNLPAAMAVSVFLMVLYYEFKLKPVHFVKELMFEPFTNLVPAVLKPVVLPINLILKLVEELAKPLSLSFRLFGNMFAGEVIFLLISFLLLGSGTFIGAASGVLVGLAWSFFHLFIGLLQAFIFMILTVVYLSIAHQPVEH
ncbi:MAG: ATP synthase F0 subunit A [Zetaproteobacteria bacterium CG_4_9_14_3_um_filter_49_83]|nr:MAG: ATP synthase F0 subunit A [Zetaproteobacteria bacterium CG17_big_fil_post_rev_8_21_14_2_50_50_13]PIV29233.1 MAG: ATP synthase F0 subunit A [Zetaproteobacteria bacterium CG02_land_8_20_14_3_00_50_9]PIY56061.1 MAG: ATP synthase F0 subunit A [Zetaproteobacteria bacterium CG_4_10_14_0_8_um_filter_49_80]PJA36408.1 MAG: ATP synthase F0 subunit A [Zetaproteobacteria bacterium CG_4_9_14_3_um_filter_49_83]